MKETEEEKQAKIMYRIDIIEMTKARGLSPEMALPILKDVVEEFEHYGWQL